MDRIEYRKLNASESGITWQDSHMLVILTAGACLLALIISLKSILDIPVERLTMELIICSTVLGGLVTVYPLVTRRRSDLAISHPGIWILLIVIITMSVIIINAI